ncbi:MAG: sigma-70 family RNA polymerase sigma factor, partial [Solirubrobacterales bacterium]
ETMSPSPLRHPARMAGASLMRLQSDERLAELAAHGHEAAFDAIVDRYRTPLTRYCAGIVGPSRAEDVVQQALINAHNALQRTDEVRHHRSWLYRIAHNAALNALRAVRDDVPLDEASGAAAVAEDGPVATFERSERFRATVDALRELPERQRAALVLRELEGRSHEEIAQTLGVTSGAARQHLMRARVALRGAVTAITPYPLVVRLAELLASPGATGWTDAAVGAGAGATLAKLTAGVAATGALVGGAVGTERVVHHHRDGGQAPAQQTSGNSAAKPRRVETRAVSLPASVVTGNTGSAASGSGPKTSGASGTDDRKGKRDGRANDHGRDRDGSRDRGPGVVDHNRGSDDLGRGRGSHGRGARSGAPGGGDGNDDHRGRGGRGSKDTSGAKDKHGSDGHRAKGKSKGRGSESRRGSTGVGQDNGSSTSGRGHKDADDSSGSGSSRNSGNDHSVSSTTPTAPITEPATTAPSSSGSDTGADSGSSGSGRSGSDDDSGSSDRSGSSVRSDAD